MLAFNFQPFPDLQTERLRLRQLTAADTDTLFALRSDDAVLKYLSRPKLHQREEALAMIERINKAIAANETITWAMEQTDSGKMIGTVGYWRAEPQNYRAEIGYFMDPAFQGMGLMRETLDAVIPFAFNEMKLHSIEANTDPLNTASRHLLEKAGFLLDGIFRQNTFFEGRFLDNAAYSLLTPGAR